jgi:hypothetical protein
MQCDKGDSRGALGWEFELWRHVFRDLSQPKKPRLTFTQQRILSSDHHKYYDPRIAFFAVLTSEGTPFAASNQLTTLKIQNTGQSISSTDFTRSRNDEMLYFSKSWVLFLCAAATGLRRGRRGRFFFSFLARC